MRMIVDATIIKATNLQRMQKGARLENAPNQDRIIYRNRGQL